MKKKTIAAGIIAAVGAASSFSGLTVQADSIQNIAASAVPVANEYGLYPSVMIAQAILESGGGTSLLASQYNNYFGVKYTSGAGVDLPTTEYVNGSPETVVAKFQAYDSPTDSFADQGALLQNYYSGTLRENASSYQDATAALQGHYATDPNYANLLNNIISTYDLTAYDGGGATTPAAAGQAASGNSYTVQSGDTLSSIAAANGTTVAALAAANGIGNTNQLSIGQVLQLTDGGTASVSADSTGGYTVKAGDSLWSIAQANGTTASNLAAVNGLSADSILQIGQSLQLTGTAAAAGTASSDTYTVKAGDTLSAIAAANGTTVDALVSLNGLASANSIAIGQTLNL